MIYLLITQAISMPPSPAVKTYLTYFMCR